MKFATYAAGDRPCVGLVDTDRGRVLDLAAAASGVGWNAAPFASMLALIEADDMGLELADALHRLYPEQFHLDKTIELLGSQSTLDRLARGDAPADIIAGWAADLDRFRAIRAKYLLYD